MHIRHSLVTGNTKGKNHIWFFFLDEMYVIKIFVFVFVGGGGFPECQEV